MKTLQTGLESITSVNEGMKRFTGNILFTSHDYEFIQTIANRIIEITDNGIKDYRMTYDEYLEKNKEAMKKETSY